MNSLNIDFLNKTVNNVTNKIKMYKINIKINRFYKLITLLQIKIM